MTISRQIEVFRAMMMSGRVTSAADQLGISQPAASRLILQFEATLGLRLFERSKQRLIPTDDAYEILRSVEQHYVGISQIRRLAELLKVRDRLTFRLAAPPNLAVSVLPPFIHDFAKDQGIHQFELHCLPSYEVMSGVSSGRYDLGLGMVLPQTLGIVLHHLPATPIVAVIPCSNILSGRNPIDIRDLEGQPFIALTEDTPTGSQVRQLLQQYSVNCDIRLVTQTANVACEFANLGMGIALVDILTASYFKNDDVMIREFVPTVKNKYCFIRREARQMNDISKLFIDNFIQTCTGIIEKKASAIAS